MRFAVLIVSAAISVGANTATEAREDRVWGLLPPSGQWSDRAYRTQSSPSHGISEPEEIRHRITPFDLAPRPKTTGPFQTEGSECSSQFLGGLEGSALVDYLRSHPLDGCLSEFMWTFDQDLASVFTDDNLQTVFESLGELSSLYDGTNAFGLRQLWFFAHVAYFYEFFEADVAPFIGDTETAHVAASAAFVANSHIYDPTDEAVDILAEWLIVTDHKGLRHRHLPEIVQVLLLMDPNRTQDERHRATYNHVFTILFRGIVNGDQAYLAAISEDVEIVATLVRVARYDLPPESSYVVENAVRELARLAEIDRLRDLAVGEMTDLVSVYPRLSDPFLVLAKGLEPYADCLPLDICREVLVNEISALAFPNTYAFDDGKMVFVTSLDDRSVQILYHAAKQVQSQFFRLIETASPQPDDVNDAINIRIYASRDEYVGFQEFLFDLSTDNGGIYIEADATFYTYQRTSEESVFTLEELFRHEYVHYLAGRYIHQGLWGQTELYQDCRLTWFDEGLAEFLAGSTQAQGVAARRSVVESISSDCAGRFAVNQVLSACYSDGFGFYPYSGMLFSYLHQLRRTTLLELVDLVIAADVADFDSYIEALAGDAELEDDYQSFLDRQGALVADLGDPSTSFPDLRSLRTDRVSEIETVFRQTSGDADATCNVSATRLNHRFACRGELVAADLVTLDRATTDVYFSALLDTVIAASIADGRLNNFESMNCHFLEIAFGAMPVATYLCDGSLRGAGVSLDSDGDGVADDQDDFPFDYLGWSDADADGLLDAEEIPDADMDGMPDGYEVAFGFDPHALEDASEDSDGDGIDNLLEYLHGTDPLNPASTPATVNLMTALRNDSYELVENRVSSLVLYAGLRFWGDRATNVRLEYRSSRPIRFEKSSIGAGSGIECTVARLTESTGSFDCGVLDDGQNGLDIFLYFTPLQSGELEIDLSFQADEIDLDPQDNSQQVAGLVIQPDPLEPIEDPGEISADFDGDGLVNTTDFFLFADAFGGTDARYDLNGDGQVNLLDFFLFAQHFGEPARAKLIALAHRHIDLPAYFQMEQNFPNPFNGSTTIRLLIVDSGSVRLDVFDLVGQHVAILMQGSMGPGLYTVSWDGRDGTGHPLASGIYLYRLQVDERAQTRKLLLVQ